MAIPAAPPRAMRTAADFTGFSKVRRAISSAASRPNAVTSRDPIRPGSAESSAAIAVPPKNAAPGAVGASRRSLMAVCTSPTPNARDGTNAPIRPPTVVPTPGIKDPAAAPASPPATLGAIMGICSPIVSFTHCAKARGPVTSLSAVRRGPAAISACSRSRPARPNVTRRCESSASPVASVAPYQSCWRILTPRSID